LPPHARAPQVGNEVQKHMSLRHPHLARLLAVIRPPGAGVAHLLYEDPGVPLAASDLLDAVFEAGAAREAAAQALLAQVGPLLAGLIHRDVSALGRSGKGASPSASGVGGSTKLSTKPPA
jgi:hypothetical protein